MPRVLGEPEGEITEPEVVLSQLSTVKAAAGHLGLVVQGQSKFII